MNEIYELLNGIITAQEELLKDKIVANTVIINSKKYGKLIEEGFYPTVCGMACYFSPLPDDFAFAVQYREPDISTSDTVSVVRCKDCKHRTINENYNKEKPGSLKAVCELDTGDYFELGRCAEDDEWFCADGERKDDET